MASVSMVASFIGGAAVTLKPSINNHRTLLLAKAAAKAEEDVSTVSVDGKDEKGSNSRRAAVFAVAAAAVSAVVGVSGQAFADQPKRGTKEARKAYAPICVTMPTARVCNKIA